MAETDGLQGPAKPILEGQRDSPEQTLQPTPPKNPSSPDSTLQAALYQALASRRTGYDTLMWQVPALSLTAQAFLFTTALGSDSNTARLISASLALILSLISVQLMSKHRFHEQIDVRLMESLEKTLALDTLLGIAPHSAPEERAAAIESKRQQYPGMGAINTNWLMHLSSYWLWSWGLTLFGLAAIGIIIITFISPGLLG